jgi:hypothetical protein
MGHAVQDDGVEARVAKRHLEPRAGGRVTRHHAVDFLAKSFEYHWSTLCYYRWHRPPTYRQGGDASVGNPPAGLI